MTAIERKKLIEELKRANESICKFCGGEGECYTSHRWTCGRCRGSGKVLPDAIQKAIEELERL